MIERFLKCNNGAIALMTALLMTVLLGMAGLGIEISYWYTIKRSMQAAADAAVIEAAAQYIAGNTTNFANNAKAVAGLNGWVDGTGGVSVSVNTPPIYGDFTSTSPDTHFEVVISRPQSVFMAWAIGFVTSPTITAHSVVSVSSNGTGCVLSPPPGSDSITISGNGNLNASTCGVDAGGSGGGITFNGRPSSMTAGSVTVDTASAPCPGAHCTVTGSVTTSTRTSNPYSGRSFTTPPTTPASCTTLTGAKSYSAGTYCGASIGGGYTFASGTFFKGQLSITGNVTFGTSPGPNVFYFDGGLNITGGTVTFNPGIYYIEGGQFTGQFAVSGNATITGTSVTIILTHDAAFPTNYAWVNVSGGTIGKPGTPIQPLSAPTGDTTINLPGGGTATEDTGGLVIFMDPSAPTTSVSSIIAAGSCSNAICFSGNGSYNFTGAIYAPTSTFDEQGVSNFGSASTCLQVTYGVLIQGTPQFSDGCVGDGTANIGGTTTASFVE